MEQKYIADPTLKKIYKQYRRNEEEQVEVTTQAMTNHTKKFVDFVVTFISYALLADCWDPPIEVPKRLAKDLYHDNQGGGKARIDADLMRNRTMIYKFMFETPWFNKPDEPIGSTGRAPAEWRKVIYPDGNIPTPSYPTLKKFFNVSEFTILYVFVIFDEFTKWPISRIH